MRLGKNWAPWTIGILLGVFGLLSLMIQPVSWLMEGHAVSVAFANLNLASAAFMLSRAVHMVSVVAATALMFVPSSKSLMQNWILVGRKEEQQMNDKNTSGMIKFIEMDETVTLQQQMGQEAGPVILINTFTVKSEDAEQLVAAWTADAGFFKQQPGFISVQLHRGVGGSCVFINYAVWESVEHFRRAFSQSEFEESLKAYPASTIA